MKFKKIILITLLLLTILTIGTVSAMDNTATNETINLENDYENSDIPIDEMSSEDIVTNDEIHGLNEQTFETNLNSNDDEVNLNNEILSSSSQNSIKTYSTEVLLQNLPSGNYYFITSINKYSNSNTKFYVGITNYVQDEYGGTVTLKLNGKYYTGEVYNGVATIIAKTPSNPGTYRATLSYSGYTYEDWGWKFNPSSSTFTLNVIKGSGTISVSAPIVTAYYKTNKYLKVSVKKNGKPINNLLLKVKVYTGSKYRTYSIKTNKNGVALLSTRNFKIGSHKVVIQSGNKNYKVSKTSKIVIKKKISYTTFRSPSGYKWQIKTSTWTNMKKQAINNYNFFKSVGSSRPGYSDTPVKVKLYRNGHTYTGTAYAVKNSKYIRCEIRGAVIGVYISDKGDQIV